MSSNKRKRGDDEGSSPHDNLQKKKKRRSHGRENRTDLDRKPSAAKSQEEPNSIEGVPEANATSLEPEVQTAKGRKRGKRRKRGSHPALKDHEASPSFQVEGQVDSGATVPDDDMDKVTPEKQETKGPRRTEKRRKIREERGAKEAPKKDKEKWDQKPTAGTAASGAAKAQKKLEKLRRSSQKEQTKGLIKSKSDRHSQHESSSRKESRNETAPTWRISEPSGGCMLRIDPLFSPSEE